MSRTTLSIKTLLARTDGLRKRGSWRIEMGQHWLCLLNQMDLMDPMALMALVLLLLPPLLLALSRLRSHPLQSRIRRVPQHSPPLDTVRMFLCMWLIVRGKTLQSCEDSTSLNKWAKALFSPRLFENSTLKA